MLKRSWPRFITSDVTGYGKPSPSLPLVFPVCRKSSITSSPRATVPGTRGRADIPSAKKSLGSSGSYRGWLAIFCLQEGRRQRAESRSRTARCRGLWAEPDAKTLLPSAFCLLPCADAQPSRERASNAQLHLLSSLCHLAFAVADLEREREVDARRLVHSGYGVL